MISLYRATNGPNWVVGRNWLSDQPISTWHGVRTNGNGRVIELILQDNGLTGNIPADLGRLSALEVLVLPQNQLTDEIPPELGELARLVDLDLTANRLSGEIPPEIGRLSDLTQVLLSENRLAGELPADLASLAKLVVLDLRDNEMTGEVPPELGELSRLEYLNLAENRLSGEIPATLGNLAALQELVLFKNRFEGPVPRELGELSNLFDLRLDFNQLSGAIPPELGRLSRLEGFEILENQLSGEVPSELTDLQRLRTLFLSRNPGLTGCMPDDLLEIEINDFEGLDLQPCDGYERTALAELFEALGGDNWSSNDGWLSDAPVGQWHGVSTDGYGRVTSLNLANNGASGEIPAALSRLTRLSHSRFGGNQISGCIPLALFSVPDNDFTDTGVPDCPPPVTLDDVSALPWYTDGLDDNEWWAVNYFQRLIESENSLDLRLADLVVNAGWFTDDINSNEAWTIGVLVDIAANYRQVLPAVVEFEWAFDDDLPGREWNTITRVRDLEGFSPGSGVLLIESEWLYDDITDVEDQALAVVRHLAEFSPGLEARIIGLPWFADGITQTERVVIQVIRDSPDAGDRMIGLPWVVDGITPDDGRAIRGLANVFSAARTLERDPSELLGLIAQEAYGPYRPLETMTMLSIGQAPLEEDERKKLLEELTGSDWFVDGLTDAERVHIIAHGTIYSEYRNLPTYNPGIMDTRVFDLPLAGELKLWMVGSSKLPWEDIFESLQEAAIGSEWLFGDPFPYSEVVVSIVGRFDYDTETRFFGGLSIDYGRHIALVDGYSNETQRGIIHHEVAHSYFNGLMGHGWFIEAGAEYVREFIFDLKGYSAVGDRDRLKLLVRNHCTSRGVPNVVEALADDPAVPRYCRNMIGMQLLLELEEVVGIDAMRVALRELHHRAVSRDVTNSDREIFEAFLNNAPQGTEQQVQELWDSLYGPFDEEER